ncbi:cytochrome c oxidase subunit 3 family protein [Magnetospira sp. QH-2]|uniref:cytochrome c oxidase subunit 3 family protein n=1 Tax=Magnetospira sp. (strain QH-2) TaxID=1288970 RepID=UPI0003E8172D|nr:cytochrome c oxidase subunit 3 family protein [Magnetospira sp. QH-2]CCQ73134.1 Nitric oxide reductase protein NorE [Magnetospira sp. QH-2]
MDARPVTLTPHPPPTGDDGWGPLSSLPGNPIMWILIWSELLVFGAALIGFAGARMLDPVTFDASQAHLDRVAGAVNTMILLTSGLLAAIAVRVSSQGHGKASRLWLIAAMAVGVLFLAVKMVEYDAKLAQGFDIETNTFFTLYYLVTGFHALHVVLGLIILAVVAWKNSLENLETGAAFWHMVDLIWVLIFPVIYLMR